MSADSLEISQIELDSMLRRRFDRPVRPLLGRVREGVGSGDSPHDACQRLIKSGMVESDLFTNSQRLFAPYIVGDRIRPAALPKAAPFPQSLETVVAIAADQEGVLRAEHAAREFAARLKPFRAICNNRVVWYLSENPFRDSHPFETSYLGQAYHAVEMTIALSLESVGIEIDRFRIGEPSERMPLVVQLALAGWEGWRFAQLHDVPLDDEFFHLDRDAVRGFEDLQNPFSPLIDTWLTGYRISASFNEDDPAIHLFANPEGVSCDR